MGLFRVFLKYPGALTEPRLIHGVNGQECPRHAGLPCRCPRVQGYIMQVWRDAASALEAQAAVEAKYPDAQVERIVPGLPDELTRRPPRGVGLALIRANV